MKGSKPSYQDLEHEIARLKSEILHFEEKICKIESRDNQEFRKRVYECSPIPIIVMDAKCYKYIDCNNAAVKIYNYSSREETLGKTPIDVSAQFQYDGSLSKEKAEYYIKKALNEGTILFEWLHQRPNGELWDAEVQLMSFVNGEETLLQFTLIDITQQKRAKERLILSEERLQSFMNSASDGFYLLDKNLNFIEINNTALKVIKRRKEDVIGKNISEIVPDVKTSGRYEKHLEVLKTGVPYIVEDFIPHPVFGDRHFIIKSFKVGSGLGVIAYDYTEQKQAEIKSNLTISQLKATLENTPNVAIQWYDISGKVLYWNKSSESLYGWNAEESIGKTLKELIHTPEEEQAFLKILHEIDTSQKPYGPFESHIHKKDGTTGWVLATTFPIPLDSHQTGFVCMDVDITDRKLAEDSLRESNEKFQAFMDNIPSMVIIKDSDLRPIFFNKEFLNHFPGNEWLGKLPEELFSPEIAATMRKADLDAFSKVSVLYEEEWIDKNGLAHILETKKFTISRKDSSPYLGTIINDITIRKKAEKELHKSEEELLNSEEKHRFLFENMTQGVVYHDSDGKIFYANQASADILGLTLDQLYGKTSMDPRWRSIQEDGSDYPGYLHPVMVTLKTGETVRNSVMGVFNPIKNSYSWININSIPKFNVDNHKIELVVVTIEDISTIKQSEMNLRENQQKLSALFASMTEMVALHDVIIDNEGNPINYRITDCNVAYTKITGIPKEQAIGKLATEVYGTETPPYLMEFCMVGITGESKYFETYFPPMDKYLSISVVSPGKNKFATVTTDITGLKRAEKTLRQRELYLSSIIENQPGLVWLKDTESRFLAVNNFFAESCGIKNPDLIIGKTDFDVWPKDMAEKYWSDDQEVIANKKSKIVEEIIIDKGTTIWFETYKTPVLDENGEVIGTTGFAQDISHRKRAELEIIAAKEKAEESDHLKTAFLQNMSHEIRTPMNAIIGFSDFLKKKDLPSEKKNNFVKIINESCYQLLGIVNNILTVSALETKQERINIEKFNVQTTINELIAIFVNQRSKEGVSINFNSILSKEQSEINSDKTKLTQILTNLLANAIKFTDRGFVEIGCELITERNAQFLRFKICDSGIGIPKEKQLMIFERFVQADNTIQKNYGGTGLGLSICKGFVELLGGKIWLESESGKGSNFYFTIPYKPVVEDLKTETHLDIKPHVATILIAEDDEYNYIYLSELLNGLNIQIIHVNDGLEAIDLIKSNIKIDLVLMDIKMPNMDGYTAAKCIKGVKPDLPIIAQSAYALEHEILKYKDIFNAYITKPINIDKIKKVLAEYIK